VSALSPEAITIAWEAAEDDGPIRGYQVFRDGQPAGEVAGTTFSDDGLRARTSHCYAVAAIDAAENRSPRSRPVCAETPDWAPPAPPPSVRAAAVTERQVAIFWERASDDVGVVSYEVLRGGAVIARLPGTEATDSGLVPAQTYCYTVRALDASGNVSDAAGPACAATPDLTPPTAPDGLVAEAAGEHAVKLRWNPSADDVGVAGYEVVRAGKPVVTTAEIAATVGGQRPLVEVCLQVRAYDAAGNRSPPAGPACATPPDLSPPSVPHPVVATATSDRRVELRWAASTDEVAVAGYEVLRDGKPVATTDATSAGEDGLSPGREYCYVVRARDTVGNVSAAARKACAVTPDLTPPTAPPRFAAAPSSSTHVAFAWGAATDDVGVVAYEIRRAGQVVARVDGRETTASEAGLAPATEHCYDLVAVDRAGNRSPAHGPVCARTAEPGVPAGPTVLRAEPRSQSMVTLRWDSSPDPDVVYTVYWDNGKKIGATARTEYTVAGLRMGENRCYRVAAVAPDGKESPRTMETCVAAEGVRR
jgi:chitodextrinase